MTLWRPKLTDQERLKTYANYALPVLLERAGGEATVSVADVEAVRARYGGRLLIKAEGYRRASTASGSKGPDPATTSEKTLMH